MRSVISVVIVTPQGQLFEDSATAVVIPAIDGYLEFRVDHSPLITTLGIGTMSVTRPDESRRFIYIDGGYAEMFCNQLRVIADHAERGEKIDFRQAQAERDQAEKRILDQESGKWDIDKVRAALHRAKSRLETYDQAGKGSN